METEQNQKHIGIAGIARSGSDSTCQDGKCNEVIGLEFKNGSFVPYQPTPYTLMDINTKEAVRTWIHHTSLQKNWIVLGSDGNLYWAKERESDDDAACVWRKVIDSSDSYWSFDCKIDFVGNLIAFGNSTYYLFCGADDDNPYGHYQKFSRDLIGFDATFGAKIDKVYGVRNRVRWDSLCTMGENPIDGFADNLNGLFNKLDSKALEDNRIIGHAFIRYAFRLYDGSYLYASQPIYIHVNKFGSSLFYNEDGFSYDVPEQNRVAIFTGGIYSKATGMPEYQYDAVAYPIQGDAFKRVTDYENYYFYGLNCDEYWFGTGGINEKNRRNDFNKDSGLDQNLYKQLSSAIYMGKSPYSGDDGKDKTSVQPTESVLDIGDKFSIKQNNYEILNDVPEELGWFSCLPDSKSGDDGAVHDYVDTYAARMSMNPFLVQLSKINENLKDFILSVDIFMTRPVSSFVTDNVNRVSSQHCAAHREIKKANVLKGELDDAMRSFYKIASIPYDDIVSQKKSTPNYLEQLWHWDLGKYYDGLTFVNITAKQQLEENTAHEINYNISYQYNQKIHVADFTTKLYRLQSAHLWQYTRDTYGTLAPSEERDTYQFALLEQWIKDKLGCTNYPVLKNYGCTVVLSINGQKYYVDDTQSTHFYSVYNFARMVSAFFYPDNRAINAIISMKYDCDGEIYTATRTITLKASETINYAYYFDPTNTKQLFYGNEDGWTLTKGGIKTHDESESIVKNARNNVMRVSSVGNPIVFPYSSTYTIGEGDIIGMSSNAVALSQGQFGEYPLFVFTTDGIWAMKVDTTGQSNYISQEPISREVCNNVNSICQIDGGIVFSSEKGLMEISGTEVKFLSEQINGEPNFIENRVLKTSVSNYKLTTLIDFISEKDFKDYLCMDDSFITYLYKKNKLIIYNRNMPYSYIYDIKTGTTTKLALEYDYPISDYPNDKLVSGTAISTFPIETRPDYPVQTLIQTRPLKLGNQDFKSSFRAVVRGNLSTASGFKIAKVNYKDEEYLPVYDEYELNAAEIERTLTIKKNDGERTRLDFTTITFDTFNIRKDYKDLFTMNVRPDIENQVIKGDDSDEARIAFELFPKFVTDTSRAKSWTRENISVTATLNLKDSADDAYSQSVSISYTGAFESLASGGSTSINRLSLNGRYQNDNGTVYVDSVSDITFTLNDSSIKSLTIPSGYYVITIYDESGIETSKRYHFDEDFEISDKTEDVFDDALSGIAQHRYTGTIYSPSEGYLLNPGTDYDTYLDSTLEKSFRFYGAKQAYKTYDDINSYDTAFIDIPEYVFDDETASDNMFETVTVGNVYKIDYNGEGTATGTAMYNPFNAGHLMDDYHTGDVSSDIKDIDTSVRDLTYTVIILPNGYVHIVDNVNGKNLYVHNLISSTLNLSLNTIYNIPMSITVFETSTSVFPYEKERMVEIPNGAKLVTIVTPDSEEYTVLYDGPSLISLDALLKNIRAGKYKSFDKQNAAEKSVGIYVYGSYDCEKWGFLGGKERKGDNMRDIGTTIERVSCKYVMVVFTGELKEDSRIDYIDLSAQQKYQDKLR